MLIGPALWDFADWKEKLMPLFIKYIKQNKKNIFKFIFCIIIFCIIFALYHITVEAVIYPALLCMLFLMIFFIIDYKKFKIKHNRLVQISKVPASMIRTLPECENILEEDYKNIINSLCSQITETENNLSIKYQDMMDYYTIWVHQIKTPIASMRLTLQSEDTSVSRKLQSDLFRIEQYVEMVLAFLRLDSDASDYVLKKQSVDKIIRGAVKKFSREFISRKISLEYEEIKMMIITDEKWLSFVLEQIISNALKYTKEGCIKIYLNEAKCLCIEDTGIGIDKADLPRIFEKGYTGYNGRADKKASGIGLYLCKRICDNLGIGINAKSEVGKGTIIELSLEQYQITKE